jgi:hypothetical protein
MKLFRRTRLLLLAAPLAVIGSIALAASPASAYTLPPHPIYTIYAPPGNVFLSVPDPSQPYTCPTLNINGWGFGLSDGVTVTLHSLDNAYNVTLDWRTDGWGNLIPSSAFPANWTSGFETWQVVVSEPWHLDTYSNTVFCAP